MNTVATQFGKWFVRSLVLAGAMLVAPVAGADEFRIESKQGVVESADFNTNQIVISGVAYGVALDANVEIAGTYGAYTMLTPGMNVEFLLRRYIETGQREIIDLKEMPAGQVPEEY